MASPAAPLKCSSLEPLWLPPNPDLHNAGLIHPNQHVFFLGSCSGIRLKLGVKRARLDAVCLAAEAEA